MKGKLDYETRRRGDAGDTGARLCKSVCVKVCLETERLKTICAQDSLGNVGGHAQGSAHPSVLKDWVNSKEKGRKMSIYWQRV